MRVLVCGGRTFWDPGLVYRALDTIHAEVGPINVVIEGEARGADVLGKLWAVKRKIEVSGFVADWLRWGNAAGPIRNNRMLKEGRPDYVVAFPGGEGTADMVDRATKAGVPVYTVKASGELLRPAPQQ